MSSPAVRLPGGALQRAQDAVFTVQGLLSGARGLR